MSNEVKSGIVVFCLILTVCIGLAGTVYGYQHFRVWSAGMAGQAKLKLAENEKRIIIETARAELEAAELQAEAIKIMGEAAKQYPEYRQQQFIQAFGDALNNGNIQKMIYVPTEANIPITEAGSR